MRSSKPRTARRPADAAAESVDAARTVTVRLALTLVGAATVSAAAVAALFAAPEADLTLAVLGLGIVVLLLLAQVGRSILRTAAGLENAQQRYRRLYAEEREASLVDHLTGLGNHRAFQEELARAFDQSGRYRAPVALLLVDLDEFKQVNDMLGHATGDDLLAEVGRVVRETMRRSDRAFRIGGDEFAVVCPHTSAEEALALGNRLLRRLLTDRTSGRYLRPISISGGVAAAPAQATHRLELQARADAALYRSKRNGRTLVSIFDESVDRTVIDEHARGDLSLRVAAVASTRALAPVYQPIIDLASGTPIAWEGLVRPAAGTGFENAGDLFAAAELTGRTVDLDPACLSVVAAGATALGNASLSLNISPRTFEAREFSPNALLAILEKVDVDPKRIILEITERESIEDPERLRAALQACRAAGIRIAADDVGAGNAGLRLLSQVQFDVMKVDLSLVQAGAGSGPVISVLSSLVDLARRWNAYVVAEGIETGEQLRIVRNLGIDAAQGYLLGRPTPDIVPIRLDIEALSARSALPSWASRAAS